jgi:histidine ammonia-lyase
MGMTAAHKLVALVENLENILAIEMLSSCQALDLLEIPGNPSPGVGIAKAYAAIRRVVRPVQADRPLASDIAGIVQLIQSGVFDTLV